MHKQVFLFAGPSAFGTEFEAMDAITRTIPEVVCRSPAKRGDVDDLVAATETPGVIALADGTFHSYPSVGHRELRQAIQKGWLVYGLCSMGAIRASELLHMGMLPWGRVAEMFCSNALLPDDEVALVHGQDAPYFPLSEPLVHLREFLRVIAQDKLVAPEQAAEVARQLSTMWYGYRTLGRTQELLAPALSANSLTEVNERLARFDAYRLKQQDLSAFLKATPWRYTPGPLSMATARL